MGNILLPVAANNNDDNDNNNDNENDYDNNTTYRCTLQRSKPFESLNVIEPICPSLMLLQNKNVIFKEEFTITYRLSSSAVRLQLNKGKLVSEEGEKPNTKIKKSLGQWMEIIMMMMMMMMMMVIT